MDTTTLEKANELNRKIKEFSEALNCFEYQPYCDEERREERVSSDPRLIIEFNGGDDREQLMLPMNLSDTLVDFLKAEIKKELKKSVYEFNAL
ncbi:MAG TPA: hypothetical protein VFC67_09340 [Prolixibacteraceae bacterium]|nr:hypothetical protein [Prolixibacteraceae bacterium]